MKITSEQPEPKEGETLTPVVVDGIPPLRESVWIPKALYSLLLQKGSERLSGECDVIGRAMIMKVERDELVEEMLRSYIRNAGWNRTGRF